MEEIANEISQFSYTVIAAVLTRLISDQITDTKVYTELINQMEEAEKELQNGSK